MSILDQISCKLDESFTILSGGLHLKAIETKVKLPFLSFEILRLILIFRFDADQRSGSNLKSGSKSIFKTFGKVAMFWWHQYVNPDLLNKQCKFQQI